MDPKVTKQLIETSKTLRNKFKSMKRGLQTSQEELEKSLKPITEPLQELVQRKKRGKQGDLLVVDYVPLKMKKDALTAFRITD